MTKSVKLAAGLGTAADSWMPALGSIEDGVDYVGFDTLSEAHIQHLFRVRERNSARGYFPGLEAMSRDIMSKAYRHGTKLVTNGGGINVHAAVEKIVAIAKELGLLNMKIARVTGDDVIGAIEDFRKQGIKLDNMDTGESFEKIQDNIITASAYLGSKPIVDALSMGADIIVTGRCTDSALFLGPLMHELSIENDDWNLLALGIVTGHLLECSGQSAGGNFSGKWWEIPDLENIGYPIAKVSREGEMLLYKRKASGGKISFDTVRHQLLYEIQDPANYITPDVIVDFTSLKVEDLGEDRVRISGAKGKPCPDTLKVLFTYPVGWIAEGIHVYSWPNAMEKAQTAEEIMRKRFKRMGKSVKQVRFDYIGVNSIMGPLSMPLDKDARENLNEVGLRVVVLADKPGDAQRLIREALGLYLNGPPHLAGEIVMPVLPLREALGIWPTLIPREAIESKVCVEVEEVKENC